MQMLYVCVLCASCVLHDLQFVDADRGCKRRPYGRGILSIIRSDCSRRRSPLVEPLCYATKWLPLREKITVALNISPAFDTINIHTLIRKLLQTNIPCTIIKFIANYIKGSKAYTTYRNHTSRQRQFITGVSQCGVLSPTLFKIYTSDLPPPSAPVQVMAYADDIPITSTHTHMHECSQEIYTTIHT